MDSGFPAVRASGGRLPQGPAAHQDDSGEELLETALLTSSDEDPEKAAGQEDGGGGVGNEVLDTSYSYDE